MSLPGRACEPVREREREIAGTTHPFSEWTAPLAIVALFAVGWLLVAPAANVPVIDDWVYAWSVEHLLRTGGLQVLDISAVYPLAQILWGSLFSRLVGFSFIALRLSTVTLAAVGCWAVYAILRELGCRRSTSLLGACALAVDPVYFALSFSFMTEVPFVSLSSVALWAFVRGLNRDDARLLWTGAVASVLAFLVRPIALVLPAAVALAVIWRNRLDNRRALLPLAGATLAMFALLAGLPLVFGRLDHAAARWQNLRWWFSVPITDYFRWTLNVLVVSSFPLAPLLVAYATQWRRVRLIITVTALLFVLCMAALGEVSMPLPTWQTWSLQDIAARAMIDGDLAPSRWSQHAVPWVKALGLVAAASFVAGAWQSWRGGPRWGRSELAIASLAALHLALIHLLWLYNDRYYIVFAPVVAIAGARALDRDARAKSIVAICLVLWAGIAVTGTRDMVALNAACAATARELEASGVPPWEIDAGYALNGWRLYAHPENLPPGADRRADVPFVTSTRPTRYSITNIRLPGSEVVRLIALPRATWQVTHVLYLVRRQ